MKKNLYVIYDEKAKGIPGNIFEDYSDGCVIRGLQEQQKTQPISKEVAADMTLVRLGCIDKQSELTNILFEYAPHVVGKFCDLLTFDS